ncbi:hypothetical protein DKX38_019581 [Salix brachista]|uniref:ZF-HD dimerization-type domain-containing protein n=1 Tax=Salix brachista TaxID=2182728 RepID=A0A5N5KGN1_9ROSI|nr:hypothetical protein DKX38_019581 [Salix brachista]
MRILISLVSSSTSTGLHLLSVSRRLHTKISPFSTLIGLKPPPAMATSDDSIRRSLAENQSSIEIDNRSLFLNVKIVSSILCRLSERKTASCPSKLSLMANTDSKSRPVDEESRTTTEYRECWRNHAVLAGGSAVDGCGEFTPKGDRGTKEAFIYEACGCHRNFHRKQSVKNGVVILDTHHSPPPYRFYGVSTWVEKNASGFNLFSSYEVTHLEITE